MVFKGANIHIVAPQPCGRTDTSKESLWQIPAPPSVRWVIKLDLWEQMGCFSLLNPLLFGANVLAVVFICC